MFIWKFVVIKILVLDPACTSNNNLLSGQLFTAIEFAFSLKKKKILLGMIIIMNLSDTLGTCLEVCWNMPFLSQHLETFILYMQIKCKLFVAVTQHRILVFFFFLSVQIPIALLIWLWLCHLQQEIVSGCTAFLFRYLNCVNYLENLVSHLKFKIAADQQTR